MAPTSAHAEAIKRLPSVFINMPDINNSVNWEAAAAHFDPTHRIKVASFKRSITNWIKDQKGLDGAPASGTSTPKSKAKSGGKGSAKGKRTREEGENDDEEVEKSPKKKGRKTKEVKEEPVEDDGAGPATPEQDGGEDNML